MEKDVVKITSYFVNHDKLDDGEIQAVIEGAHYPNRCMSPKVIEIERRTIDYEDNHPINKLDGHEQEFRQLFGYSRIELKDDPISPINFSLNPAELAEAKAFMARHRLPAADQSATCQQFEFKFIPTSIGSLVSIRDIVSGVEEAITDLDKF